MPELNGNNAFPKADELDFVNPWAGRKPGRVRDVDGLDDLRDSVVFHYGGQSAPDGMGSQRKIEKILSVGKGQCLRGPNEGWT